MERVRSIAASIEIVTNKVTHRIEKYEAEGIFEFLDRARLEVAEALDVDPPAPADPEDDDEEEIDACEQCGRVDCIPECSNYDAAEDSE